MIFLMPDTCIWINFLERANLQRSLAVLDGLMAEGVVQLWTTEEIKDEFNKDKGNKVRKDGVEKSLLETIVRRVDRETDKELAEAANRIVNSPRLYDRADQIEEALAHVENMLTRCRTIEGSETVYDRILHRISKKQAPFHRDGKDIWQCTNDAIIVEKFASASAQTDAQDDICVFISTDRGEYATPTDPDERHADYANIFDDHRCMFTKNIDRTVYEIRKMVNSGESPSRFRHSDRKSWNEIAAEIAIVGDHDWFHRHLTRKKNIADGTCSLKPGRSVLIPLRPPRIGVESWNEELATAERKATETPGLPNTIDPYQAGFAAGALMALKWVQGETQSPANVMARTPPERLDDVVTLREVRSA